MMWYLQSVTDAAVRFSLVPGKDMVVGRKDCDVLISWDQSISRRHAVVRVTSDEGSASGVSLTDCKSKFGTSVNGKRMGASQKISLHRDDVISFGQGPVPAKSRFRLIYEPLVFCCSAMSKPMSLNVKQLAKSLGAEVESSWSDRCSHLVMTSITVTVKVVSALSSCKPVVTPAWIEEAVRCHQSSLPLPSPSTFQPSVVDANIESGTAVSLAPNYGRTSLFQDCVFYFMSEKQHSRLNTCLLGTGATCQLFSSPNNMTSLDPLVKEQSVVLAVDNDHMKQATPTEKKWIQQVYTFLKSHDVRPVHDSEIGFALLYISVENYCNPRSTPSFSMSCPPMAPPTLSQAPLTQPHSSQHHHQHSSLPHSHTLPYTQDMQQSHPHDQTTILAPDSVELSQLQQTASSIVGKKTSSTGVTSVQKINETIRSSLDKSSAVPSPDDIATNVKTEEASECSQQYSNRPPAPIAAAAAAISDKSPFINSKSSQGSKHPPPACMPASATHTSRTSVKTTTSAKPSAQVSAAEHSGVPSLKNEPLDLLFGSEAMDEGPSGLTVGAREHQRDGESGSEREEMELNVQVEKWGVAVAPSTSDCDRGSQILPSNDRQQNRLKLKPQPLQSKRVRSRTVPRADTGEQGVSTTEQVSQESLPLAECGPSVASGVKRKAESALSGQKRKKQHPAEDSSQRHSAQIPPMSTFSKPVPSDPSQISDVVPPSPSQLEGSVIVPCSLTPRTQDKAKKTSALPDSQTLAFAFQGKRKKRTRSNDNNNDVFDKPLEKTESRSKKKRFEEGEGGGGEESGGKKKRQGVERGGEKGKHVAKSDAEQGTAVAVQQGNKEEKRSKDEEPLIENNSSSCVGKTSDHSGLFSGLKSNRTKSDARKLTGASSGDKESDKLPSIFEGLPLLETCDSIPGVNEQRKGNIAPEEMSIDVEMSKKDAERPCHVKSSRLPSQTSPPSTAPRMAPHTPDPLLFLSTRKKRRSPREPVTPFVPTTPGRGNTSTMALPLFTQHTVATQGGCTLATQRTGLRVATPFTALVTGGKRSKVSDRDTTTSLWEDDDSKDRLDGEDPLVNGLNESDSKVYRPVCDEDGFVCSRIKPRVQTSRVGRLATFADSQQYSNCLGSEHSEGSSSCGVNSEMTSSVCEPPAKIVYARLVVTVPSRRQTGREEVDGGLVRRPNGAVKNFKKFRKVQHIGAGAIPRLVSLQQYVPPTSRELQDWMVEQENVAEVEQERDEESSQDLFRFSFPKSTNTTTGRRWRT